VSEKKLFYYNLPANAVDYFEASKCFMISEKKLPDPSEKYSDICAISCKRIPEDIPLGSDVSIAAGDPIILEGERTKILSRTIDNDDPNIPEDVKRMKGAKQVLEDWDIDTFEYRGGKVWILDEFVCLLDDLEEACRKLKEQKGN